MLTPLSGSSFSYVNYNPLIPKPVVTGRGERWPLFIPFLTLSPLIKRGITEAKQSDWADY